MVLSIRYSVLGITLVVVTLFSFKGEPQKTAVEQAVDAFVNDPALRNAGIGFCMKEVNSGMPVYQYNSQQSLVPASTLKIVTTYASLKMLGEDYRFKTRLAYVGKIDSIGTLRGNILVIGGGDPTLGSGRIPGTGANELMKNWVDAIQKVGIKNVDGWIETDATRFDADELSRNWLVEDIGNYYGSTACALSFNENLYKIILKPGKGIGDPVELLSTEPKVAIDFKNQLKTAAAGSGDNAYVVLDNFGIHYLQGTIPLGSERFTIKGAYYNPPLLCFNALQAALGGEGGGAANYPRSDSVFLWETKSPSLGEIVKYTNLNSINLYAENLLRELGYTDAKGSPGTTENGVKAVVRILKEQGVNATGLFMVDGCGLSRSNGVSADFLVDVLQKGYFSKAFYESLPVAGRDNAMKSMGNGTAIDGNMRAKTGHMERVRSYAGYVKGKDGKMYSFALIVNNYNCSSTEIKQKIEKVLVALGS
jgi:D-alanyl-D-alanine carboxypeptidase/D-alanyl-D-alanine-endopeptidase (penicillin-binding protein 4)